MLRIYLAARVSRCQDMQTYAAMLQRHNIAIVSSWVHHCLESEHANRSDMPKEERARVARQDLSDIDMAHVVMLFAEPTPGTGNGRLVEFGYGLGTGKECWVVGPLENLFMCTSNVVHLPTWEEAYAYAQEECQHASSSHGYQGRAARSDGAAPGAVR